MTDTLAALERDGFVVVTSALSADDVARFAALAQALQATDPTPRRGGFRDLLTREPRFVALADHPAVRAWPRAVLGDRCFVARAILFDKNPQANWKVAWHQDITIAVHQRVEAPGFGPWSVKNGTTHVQPPHHVLEHMLTVRVHLDDATADNGPLRAIAGSHRLGILNADAVEQCKRDRPPTDLLCPAGGLVLMRPLLLHASSPAAEPSHRRVVHLEFAAAPLPHGLQWRES